MGQVVHVEEIYRPLSRSKVRWRYLRDELQPLNWWLGSSSKPGQINDDVVLSVRSRLVHHCLLSSSTTQMSDNEVLRTLKTWYTSCSMFIVSASILAANRMNIVTSSSLKEGLNARNHEGKCYPLHLMEYHQQTDERRSLCPYPHVCA